MDCVPFCSNIATLEQEGTRIAEATLVTGRLYNKSTSIILPRALCIS